MEGTVQQHFLSTGFIQLQKRHLFLRAEHCNNPKRQAIIVLPPFAEEMNKSRHLISALMRQLSDAGSSSFMLDNYGTGDSEGDLDQATISLWRDDLYHLIQLLKQQGYRSISFIAVRFGTLQLFDLLNTHLLPLPLQHIILWQPVFDVAKFWQQFLRIKVAEAMASGSKISQKELEQQLQQGDTIEIAGYPISPAFYQSLLGINSVLPAQLQHSNLSWFETSQLDTIALPVQKMLSQLQQHQLLENSKVNFVQLKAEPYWQTAELATADQLIALTVQQLTQGHMHD
ncbi:glycosyl transferase [Arsukibacterium sp. MJ3]|uniref:glycosyl transferase n=1 Tax=Arsukibacterium sp. MJ3 TaxID=1632859 RepID=UPI000626F05D|nr:glycosyl transferase [Arsukibacterium sp. MJ3]KKO49320.1 glycosyl transferase [Arsukibacterium sp. MJ3]